MATKDNNTCKVALNDETLIDLTDSNVTAHEVAEGFVFYTATGAKTTGSLKTNIFKYDIIPDSDFTSVNDVFSHLENEIDKLNIIVRNGDFLLINEYFVSDITDQQPALSTYIYNADISAVFNECWISIGSATLTDGITTTLVNGKVALKGSDTIASELNHEYFPYLKKTSTEDDICELGWLDTELFLTKIQAIEHFFNSAETKDTVDTLHEIQNKLIDLSNETATIPAQYLQTAEITNITYEEMIELLDPEKNPEGNEYTNTLTNVAYFNRVPENGQRIGFVALIGPISEQKVVQCWATVTNNHVEGADGTINVGFKIDSVNDIYLLQDDKMVSQVGTNTTNINSLNDQKLNKSVYEAYITGKTMSDAALKLYADNTAVAKVQVVSSKIDTEISRAKAAEANLQNLIENLSNGGVEDNAFLITNTTTNAQIDQAIRDGYYKTFIFTDNLTVTTPQQYSDYSTLEKLKYIVFNLTNAKHAITIKTENNIRLNSILQINVGTSQRYIPTIEGNYSTIEIMGIGAVNLHDVKAVSQVAIEQFNGNPNENRRGLGGIVIKPYIQTIDWSCRTTTEYSNIQLNIQGSVYAEGAINGDGVQVIGGYVTISGDALTAIGNHGIEKWDHSNYCHFPDKWPKDYIPQVSSNYASAYEVYWEPKQWDVSTLQKSSNGAGIGLANSAAFEGSIAYNSSTDTVENITLGYGYYINNHVKNNCGLIEASTSHPCGEIYIKNLRYLKACGYGQAAPGIGGGAIRPNDNSDTKCAFAKEIRIYKVDTIIARGGFAAQDYWIAKSQNPNDEHYTLWNWKEPNGGPGIGAASTNRFIKSNKIVITQSHILQAIGGAGCAAIGGDVQSNSDIMINNSHIEQAIGGCGAAAIGGGYVFGKDKDHLVGQGKPSDQFVNININNSIIFGFGGANGAIVGSGSTHLRADPQPKHTIYIKRSSITGVPGNYAAGIGSGYLTGTVEGQISEDTHIDITMGDIEEKATWLNTSSWGIVPFTKAQKIGTGCQDISTGGKDLVRFEPTVEGTDWYAANPLKSGYRRYLYKKNGTTCIEEHYDKVERPIKDLPWIGELLIYDDGLKSRKAKIYYYTNKLTSKASYTYGENGALKDYASCITDSYNATSGLGCIELQLGYELWNDFTKSLTIAVSMKNVNIDGETRSWNKTFVIDPPAQVDETNYLIIPPGVLTLDKLGKTEQGISNWGWGKHPATAYNNHYFDYLNYAYFMVPDGQIAEIETIDFKGDSETTDIEIMTRFSDNSEGQTFTLWRTSSSGNSGSGSYNTISLPAGTYWARMVDADDGYASEYNCPNPENVQIKLRYFVDK